MRVVQVELGPVVLDGGEGKYLGVLGDLYRFLATGQATGGVYAAWEIESFPGMGPPPHIHHREAEMFYVLEGEFNMLCGDRLMRAKAGAFAHVPAGTLHTHKNVGNEPGRLLVVVTPAGFEKFLEEVGHPVDDSFSEPVIDPADMEKIRRLAPLYHLEIRE